MIKYTIFRAISIQESAKLLNLTPGFTPEELKKAYLSKVKQHHPDMKGGDPQEFRKISEAYNFLKSFQVKLPESPEVPYDWASQSSQFQYQNAPKEQPVPPSDHSEEPEEPENLYKPNDSMNLGIFALGIVGFAIWSLLTRSHRSVLVDDIEEQYRRENPSLEEGFLLNSGPGDTKKAV
jgi:hypothetical protein